VARGICSLTPGGRAGLAVVDTVSGVVGGKGIGESLVDGASNLGGRGPRRGGRGVAANAARNADDDVIKGGRRFDPKMRGRQSKRATDEIVDELEKELPLTKDQRERLHRAISKQRYDDDVIRQIAEDIKGPPPQCPG